MVTPAKARPGTREERDVATLDATDSPWVTLVWDDPVNLMTYVTYVFQKLFGYSPSINPVTPFCTHWNERAPYV